MRQGRITLNGVAAQVSQAGVTCRVEISAQSQSIAASGGSGAVDVTAPAGCAWSVSSSAPWLTISSGPSGTGNGTVTFQVAANSGVARLAALTIGDKTFVVTQATPAAPQCNYAIQTSAVNIAVAGGTTVVNILADAGCSWTAASNVPWLAVSGAGVGTGNGSVTIIVSTNTGAPRNGTVTIASRTFTVNQAGSCAASLNPPSATVPTAGGAGPSIAVTIAPGCAWTASTADSWLSITQGYERHGQRSGRVFGNGKYWQPAQRQPDDCRTGICCHAARYMRDVDQPGVPVVAGHGRQRFGRRSIGRSMRLDGHHISTMDHGHGRSFRHGQRERHVHSDCKYRQRPNGHHQHRHADAYRDSGGLVQHNDRAVVAISTGRGWGCDFNHRDRRSRCTWTATPSQNWITITSGASGSGNGTVGLSIAANTGPARTATVTVAGQTHTVSQASGCTYSITPTSHSLDKDAQTPPTIAVTTAAGCTWTAVSNDSFITVESGDSGTGSGTVKYKVTKNTGSGPRTGTLTIAGLTFTVIQDNR
jgi:hypothetical protein